MNYLTNVPRMIYPTFTRGNHAPQHYQQDDAPQIITTTHTTTLQKIRASFTSALRYIKPDLPLLSELNQVIQCAELPVRDPAGNNMSICWTLNPAPKIQGYRHRLTVNGLRRDLPLLPLFTLGSPTLSRYLRRAMCFLGLLPLERITDAPLVRTVPLPDEYTEHAEEDQQPLVPVGLSPLNSIRNLSTSPLFTPGSRTRDLLRDGELRTLIWPYLSQNYVPGAPRLTTIPLPDENTEHDEDDEQSLPPAPQSTTIPLQPTGNPSTSESKLSENVTMNQFMDRIRASADTLEEIEAVILPDPSTSENSEDTDDQQSEEQREHIQLPNLKSLTIVASDPLTKLQSVVMPQLESMCLKLRSQVFEPLKCVAWENVNRITLICDFELRDMLKLLTQLPSEVTFEWEGSITDKRHKPLTHDEATRFSERMKLHTISINCHECEDLLNVLKNSNSIATIQLNGVILVVLPKANVMST